MLNKEIKTIGKNTVRSNRIKAVILTAFSLFITALFTVAGFLCNKYFNYYISLPATFIILILTLIFFSAYSLGKKAWYSGKLNKNKSSIKRFIYWLLPNHSFKAFRFNALLFLLKLFWTVVAFLPAAVVLATIIILADTGGIEFYFFISLVGGLAAFLIIGLIFRFTVLQRYFLAPFLISSNPKLKPLQAVNQSKNLLDGHIGEIIRFKLSFFPWFMSCLFIIPAFYFVPYYKQSCSTVAKFILL